MKLADGSHLSYCTNIHAGESWPDAFAALRQHVPDVRAALGDASATAKPGFGLGLRLSHDSLCTLEQDDAFDAFRQWLKDSGCYVFTINGFPYGPFHGETVKADVYRPDWTEPARLDYTRRLISLAGRLGKRGDRLTISTLPGTFKGWVGDERETTERLIADQLLACVAHCVHVHETTGVEVGIALEPEPCCLLETADEVCDFFSRWLFSDAAVERVAELTASSTTAARRAIRTHLGVCHDVCHSAVEFEAPLAAVTRYRDAGIAVLKLQLSSALRLAPADEAAREALTHFDEGTYLHQVVRREPDGTIVRHPDIDEALASDGSLDAEWRVHFHVPVFLERMEAFGTTQATLADLLDAQRTDGLSPHLEIETYTWDVLPAVYRDVPIATAIAREIDWVHARLVGVGTQDRAA